LILHLYNPERKGMHSFNNNKTIFILNPNAGITGIRPYVRRLRKCCNEFDFSIFSDIEEFRSFIKTQRDDYDLFIAVGGDGTVNSLASQLIDSEKILGVLPIGSGNGFAREMGFRKNFRSLIEDIRRKEFFEIDVLFINDMPSINVAGIGIDSLVAHEFHKLHQRGIFNYGMSALKTVGEIKPFKASITIGDNKIEDEFFMISFANTRQFGNNAYLAPMAHPDDGKFNIVLVRPFPKILSPGLVVKMMSGTLKDSKYIKYIESDEPVTIESEETRVHIDGEPVIITESITVSIRRNALRVLKSSFNDRIKTGNGSS
jgi:diacylglycerol kinase (ATP)